MAPGVAGPRPPARARTTTRTSWRCVPWTSQSIAAVNGAAAGAGVGLALACDLRLLAEGATFVPAFSAIGLVPDSGTSWLTVQLLGYARAFAWLTSGRRIDAAEALGLGLADEVVASRGPPRSRPRAGRGARGDARPLASRSPSACCSRRARRRSPSSSTSSGSCSRPPASTPHTASASPRSWPVAQG